MSSVMKMFAGAFLVPYLITMVVVGIPLVHLETTLGQFSSAGCISVFNINPLFKGKRENIIFLFGPHCLPTVSTIYLALKLHLAFVSLPKTQKTKVYTFLYILGAGYAVVLLNVMGVMYFATIMSYPLLYMFHSFTSPLPWQYCGNSWNTDKCVEVRSNQPHWGVTLYDFISLY